jgi:hypothetical protein
MTRTVEMAIIADSFLWLISINHSKQFATDI